MGKYLNFPRHLTKATHSLVFMFQPLAESYAQSTAVFASKSPVVGLTFTQVIIKSVVYWKMLEQKCMG